MNATPESDSGFAPDHLRPHERAAANWALRVRRGLTVAEEKQFEHWCAEHPEHAIAFAELDATSRLLDQLRQPVSGQPAGVPLAGANCGARSLFTRARLLAPLAAAAAILVGWSVLSPRLPFRRPAVASKSAPAVAPQPRQMTLADGSTVQLSAEAILEIHFTEAERRVQLRRGEAYFEVAKNPLRPFLVEANDVFVRAVGTAFNVRYHRQALEVIVTEGSVRLDRAGQPVLAAPDNAAVRGAADRLLAAGEKATLALAPAETIAEVSAAAAPPAPVTVESWRSRMLEFVDASLPEMVAEFNRHNPHKLVIRDGALAALRFGGVFAPTGYESLVETLEQNYGVAVERKAGETVLRKAR